MFTTVGKPTTYHNQALCVAGTEYGIGDTIPYIKYKKSESEDTLHNTILHTVNNGSITVTNENNTEITIPLTDIIEI